MQHPQLESPHTRPRRSSSTCSITHVTLGLHGSHWHRLYISERYRRRPYQCTFDQPSSNDHVGEAGLSAIGRQTHHVGHFFIGLVSSALLCLRHPHRSKLVPHHERRICCLAHQQHLGSCPSPYSIQRCYRQIDLQAQVQRRWFSGMVQGSLGPSRHHPATRHRLR
jgi:hypothetical protein